MKFRFICLLLILPIFAIGQPKNQDINIINNSVKWIYGTISRSECIGSDKNGLYTVSFKNLGPFLIFPKIQIEQFSHHNMKLIKKSKNLYGDIGHTSTYHFPIYLNNQIFIIYSNNNNNKDKYLLFAKKVNRETLQPYKKSIKLAKKTSSSKSSYKVVDCKYYLSSDSSKILISYNLSSILEESKTHYIHVYDNEFNLLWNQEIKLTEGKEIDRYSDHLIDNDGKVYILIGESTNYEKKLQLPTYQYSVVSFFKEQTKKKLISIKLDSIYLASSKIALTKDQDILCAGFYSNANIENTDLVKGSYTMLLDRNTLKLKSQDQKEFGLKFQTTNVSKRTVNKIEENKIEYRAKVSQDNMDYILFREDGGAYLIGEKKRIVRRFSNNNRNQTLNIGNYYKIYNTGSIFIISISPEGTIEWEEKIGKTQYNLHHNNYYSYQPALVNNELYFLYNDHIKNLNYNGEGKVKKYRGKHTLPMLVKIDREGNQSRQGIFSTKKAKLALNTKLCRQISEKEMFLLSGKHRNHSSMIRLRRYQATKIIF